MQNVSNEDEMIAAALERAATSPEMPSIVHVEYLSEAGVLIFRTSEGKRLTLPREEIECLASAPSAAVAEIEIQGDGQYLHWPKLDFDLYVPELMKGRTGNAHWMRVIGQKGGAARTRPKRDASRTNGKRGGRPAGAKTSRSSFLIGSVRTTNTARVITSGALRLSRERRRAAFAVAVGITPGTAAQSLPGWSAWRHL